MQVYVSQFGKVYVGIVLVTTPKGYRIERENKWHKGHFVEELVYDKCPHGNHKTFTAKHDAIEDALRYIDRKEVEANKELREAVELREKLKEFQL